MYSIPELICRSLECISPYYGATSRDVGGRIIDGLLTVHRSLDIKSSPTGNLMHQMTLATAAPVIARYRRPVIVGGIRLAVGEMTVGHHLHHAALVGTHRV